MIKFVIVNSIQSFNEKQIKEITKYIFEIILDVTMTTTNF